MVDVKKKLITGVTIEDQMSKAKEILETIVIPREQKFQERMKNMGNKFKIGIDVHGVIDIMPEFFAFLTDSIIKNGGEVHIITGGSWESVIDELESHNIRWTHSFSVYDYMIEFYEPKDGVVVFPDGTIQKKFDGDEWDMVKGNYCSSNNIQLHIDDKEVYRGAFVTPFALLS